jgi:hypothetical protein
VLYKYFSGESERLLNQEQESESMRLRLVTECRQTWGQAEAQQLWKQLGLPMVPAMADAVVQGDLFRGPMAPPTDGTVRIPKLARL